MFSQSNGCLSYEPKVVKANGTVVKETFPGRPNYESIKNGDKPEVYWILKLVKPICVTGTEGNDINTSETGITEMQLVLNDKQYKKYKKMVGQKVVVTGTLFHSHTVHHKTNILITVKSMVVG